MKLMRMLAVAALLVSSVSAETAPLPAGKPAGTKEASLFGLAGLPLYLTIAALGLTIAAAAGAIAIAALLGLLRGSAAVATPGPGTIDGNFGARPVVLTGVVRSSDPGRSQAIVDATHLSDADTDRSVSGGVLVSGRLIPALSPGDRVEIDASGLHPLDRRPGPDSEATLEREGVVARRRRPRSSSWPRVAFHSPAPWPGRKSS